MAGWTALQIPVARLTSFGRSETGSCRARLRQNATLTVFGIGVIASLSRAAPIQQNCHGNLMRWRIADGEIRFFMRSATVGCLANGGGMFVAVYWWRVHRGKEEQFRRAWRRGTQLIQERYGSYGSRLHRDADGRFVGYAEWPDEATWRAAFNKKMVYDDPETRAAFVDA